MDTYMNTKEMKTWRVIILCALVILLEGFDIQIAGVSATKLAPAFKLLPEQLGLFLSASAFGIFAAAALGGILADKIGRKPVVVAGVFVFGLGSLSTLLAGDLTMLCAARILTGIGLGAAMPNVLAYASDYSPKEMKKRAIGFIYCAIPIGGFLAGATVQSGLFGEGWQSVYVVGGLAPLIVAPILLALLPTHLEANFRTVKGSASNSGAKKLGIVEGLFGGKRGIRTLELWIGTFGTLLCMYLLLGWMPSLLVKMGLTKVDAQYAQMMYNFAAAVGAATCGYLLDKKLLYSTTSLAYIGLAIILSIFGFGHFGFGASALLAAGLGFMVTLAQAIVYAFAPLCYEDSIRNTGVGAAVAAGRLGTIAGPLLAGSILGTGQSAADVLKILVPIVLFSGFMTFLVVRSFKTKESLKTEA